MDRAVILWAHRFLSLAGKAELGRSKVLKWIAFAVSAVLCSASVEKVGAGVTASQWVVVVNGNSSASRTIANHYCVLRGIPDRNVIVLKEVPALERTTSEEYRSKILQPIVVAIQERGLAGHIQGIAFSADFPTAIDFTRDVTEIKDLPKYLRPVGSLNGLTYLYKLAASKSPQLLNLEANLYACRDGKSALEQAFPERTVERRDAIQKLLEDKKFEDAKKLTRELVNEYRNHYYLIYRLAQMWSDHDQPDTTLDLLETAVESGWCFRKYLAEDVHFASLHSSANFQVLRDSCPEEDFAYQPTRGFTSAGNWSRSGIPLTRPEDGVGYLLSMVLAVTRGEGNTVDEAIAQLKTSAEADYSKPKGTFYFTSTADVRSTTRAPSFPMAFDRLKRLGYDAKIVTTAMPMNAPDCLGITMGVSDFNWSQSKSKIVPGAIGDNLTSSGGVMTPGSGQTKLTEYLRYGAAGGSGAVYEPYSIQAKFPHPMIHAHYAAGVTLAEAFYLSITGPYQMLIVGDPLCQPFARTCPFQFSGMDDGDAVERNRQVFFKPEGSNSDYVPVKIDLLIDDQLRRAIPFVQNLNLKLENDIPDGIHSFTFIVSDDSPIEQKWEFRREVVVGDASQVVQLEPVPSEIGSKTIRVHVKAPEGAKISLKHHHETIGSLEQSEGELVIDPDRTGRGPVRLHVEATVGEKQLRSREITIEVP